MSRNTRNFALALFAPLVMACPGSQQAKIFVTRKRVSALVGLAVTTIHLTLILNNNSAFFQVVAEEAQGKQNATTSPGWARSGRFSLSSLWDLTQLQSQQEQHSEQQLNTILQAKSTRSSNLKCGHQLDSHGNPRYARQRHARHHHHHHHHHNQNNSNIDYHLQRSLGKQTAGRIVGGHEGSIRDYPWFVSLQRERSFWFGLKAFYHSCGGSLIAPSWILTAAHCLYEREEPLRAVAGTDNMNFLYRAQIRTVERQFYHESFDIGTYDNDIALIKVSEPFNLDSTFSPIGLICLDRDAPVLAYDIATICGFGARAFRQKARSHLYETDIAIIDQQTCNNSFGNSITDNMICAGGMIQEKRDACSGDGGGPDRKSVW